MANETWEKHTMTMDDAEYDAVAAAITKALLEQEIKELLEEHEKMDDTDDENDESGEEGLVEENA